MDYCQNFDWIWTADQWCWEQLHSLQCNNYNHFSHTSCTWIQRIFNQYDIFPSLRSYSIAYLPLRLCFDDFEWSFLQLINCTWPSFNVSNHSLLPPLTTIFLEASEHFQTFLPYYDVIQFHWLVNSFWQLKVNTQKETLSRSCQTKFLWNTFSSCSKYLIWAAFISQLIMLRLQV